MDWRSWCRLCGNYETIVKIEPEVEDIAAKLSVRNQKPLFPIFLDDLSSHRFDF